MSFNFKRNWAFAQTKRVVTTGDLTSRSSSSETLTNKRVTPRISSAATAATLTVSADQHDAGVLTAQATALLIANPTGTPTALQELVFRIKDNGTARAISYGNQFRALGVTLPVTTVATKTHYLHARWNESASKWDVHAVQQEA
jgi:hypothetical protein